MKTTQETWQRCCCCHPVCLWWRYQPSIHPSIQYHRISQERFVALFGLFIQKYYKKKNNGKCQHSEWIGMTKSRNNHWINIAILVCYSIIHLRRTRFDSIRFNSIIMFDFPTFRWTFRKTRWILSGGFSNFRYRMQFIKFIFCA